ncbi:chloride channel protein, partial [Mesorhizobium sp. M2A.F.Ca.ET.067.02.1.1]
MAGISRKYPMLRRSHAMWVSRRVWQPRLVFWAGAISIGLISVLFALLADRAQALFHVMTGNEGGWRFYLPLIVTPLGFVLCAWLTHSFFPGSQGSGIPQAIAARHLRDEDDRSRILSLRLVVGKIALTIAGLACGASIGREGPTVQVGASLMLQAARWGGMAQARGLILAGSAAGIAAAFNTPLAGIVFAIEEMGRTYEARTNGLVLTAVILAGLASLGLLGNYTYFGVAKDTVAFAADWPLVLACGIFGGGVGALFSLSALKVMRRIRRWNALQPLPRALVVAAVCGLAVAVIGVASGGLTFGTGYAQARGAIEGTPLPAFFFVEKFAAGMLSMVSG